jgi:threonylcarbamoyladenosine tRNA methylthiotransferase MtaB
MIAGQFAGRGFDIVDSHQQADIYLLNTCSVTARASRECRQVIRRIHRQSPDATIVVVGCYAQLEPREIASIEGVDLILGTREKFSAIDYLDTFIRANQPRIDVGCIDDMNDFGPAYTASQGDRTRAFLKIQDGCDYTCSYCTIPKARGESRSQDIPATVSQAAELVSRGFREIVLTGVNVGDYGRKQGVSLIQLLEKLEQVDGLERIRISSIEPNLLNDDLLQFVEKSAKVCRHFHIPLQSGHDDILRAMRRRYRTADYNKLIETIHSRIPEAGIGADVIVGFPGETDEHFASTYAMLSRIPITYLHVFSYSERPGTYAASMGDAIQPRECTRRSAALRNLSARKKKEFYSTVVGKTVHVLVEDMIQSGMMEGLTDNYVRVRIPAHPSRGNSVVPVHVKSYDDSAGMCIGDIDGV